MPPSEAKDNLILDAFLNALAAIGTPATEWLTNPVVEEGPPPDSIPPVDVRPRIYLDQPRTDFPSDGQNVGPSHRWRTHLVAYVCAKNLRTANQGRADVLRAVYAAEGSIQTQFGLKPRPEESGKIDDLVRAGVYIKVQPFFLDHQTDHTAT